MHILIKKNNIFIISSLFKFNYIYLSTVDPINNIHALNTFCRNINFKCDKTDTGDI